MSFLKKFGSATSRLFGSKGKSQPAGRPPTISEALDRARKRISERGDERTKNDRAFEEGFNQPRLQEEEAPYEIKPTDLLQGVEEAEWVPLISSNVDRIRWAGGQLQVVFKNGSLYQYEGVEEEIYQAFLSTHSPGQYVWYVLRAYGYPYAKLSTGHSTSTPAAPRYDETPFAVPDWIEQVQAQAGRTSEEPSISTKAPAGSNAPPKAPFTNQTPPKVPARKGRPPSRP